MGESTKTIRIFVIVVLSLFMLAMIYFTASVIKGFKNGALRAENDFMRITETASSAVFFDTNSSALNELRTMLTGNDYVAAALVASEKNILFAYPTASPLIGMNIEGKSSVRSSSPMVRIFSTRLPAAPDDNTMLTVALYAVRSADIYNPARMSFLVILAGLAAIFAALIYISKNEPSISPLTNVSSEHTAQSAFEANGMSSVLFSDDNVSYEKTDTKNPEHTPVVLNETPAESVQEQIFALPEGALPDELPKRVIPHDLSDTADENSSDVSDSEIPISTHTESFIYDNCDNSIGLDSLSDPSGLFSPATGVGWEQYLETRLDSELMRSASSEQDLALVLLRIPGIESNRLMMKKIAAVLLDFFKFKDFVFEYQNDGFAGILLNINLDQTMILAETIYRQFKELLESENIPPKLAVGISMRSLRLLSGSRLIDEADKALHRAFGETGMPIVAFRVNPDKYRQFMADSAGAVNRQ